MCRRFEPAPNHFFTFIHPGWNFSLGTGDNPGLPFLCFPRGNSLLHLSLNAPSVFV